MAINDIKILFVASEMEPFVKVGGIADVIGTLPVRLASLGTDVRVVIPYYRQVKENLKELKLNPKNLTKKPVICLDWLPYDFEIKEVKYKGVRVYFICRDDLFDRREIYTDQKGEFQDNDLRSGFLSLGALEIAKTIKFKPDIIHCHDWQTALVPICLRWRKHLKDDEYFKDSKVVFTIHNISYQGEFSKDMLDKFGLPAYLFTSQSLELFGKVNLLKGAILYSDMVTTVSPSYAEEIKKREFGYGLDAVLKWISRKSNNLRGILNGVDYDRWDPDKDGAIYENFNPKTTAKISVNKIMLRKELGLELSEDKPLLSVVSKLTEQKGLDLLVECLPQILDLGYQVAVLGSGDRKYENLLRKAKNRYKKDLSVTIGLDDKLERKIFAGSDMLIMPSRFEPCGLGQIIALRYGTIPVARGTGGLLDTVRDYTADSSRGNGFVFDELSKLSLLDALIRAISVYENKGKWERLVKRAMKEDYSWRMSGKRYLEMYKGLLSVSK